MSSPKLSSQLIEIAVKGSIILALAFFVLSLASCKTIEHVEREAPNYIKEGCKVPEPTYIVRMTNPVTGEQIDVPWSDNTSALEYKDELIARIKDCDSRMRVFSDE